MYDSIAYTNDTPGDLQRQIPQALLESAFNPCGNYNCSHYIGLVAATQYLLVILTILN